MEKIKEVILDSLPSSAKCHIEKILERLEEKGVDCFDDLKYIKFDEDFSDILKDVPARKLKEKVDNIFSANSKFSNLIFPHILIKIVVLILIIQKIQ